MTDTPDNASQNGDKAAASVKALRTHAAYCRRIARPGLADAIDGAAALYEALWVPGGPCYTMPDGDCISLRCDLHTPPTANPDPPT